VAAAVFVSLQAVALVAFETWRARASAHSQSASLIVALVLGPPVLLFGVSYLMRPVFVARALMPASVAYAILAGYAAASARFPVIKGWLAGLFILGAALTLPAHYTDHAFPRSPFQRAVAALQGEASPGDVVLHDNKLSYFPMRYYAPALPQTFLPDQPGSHNDTFAPVSQQAMGIYPADDLLSAVAGADTIWCVVFARALDEHREQSPDPYPPLAALENSYALIQIHTFNDLLIYQFH